MTIKKIETYAKFTPRPLDTSKAEKYRAYANVGKQLMNMADQFAQTKAAQRGKEEGLLAVKESRKETLLPDGTTEVTYTPVERKTYGYAASSFNQTVDQLSTSMRVSDATINFAKFEQEFKDDPVSFINTSNAYIDGLIEQTDPSQQEVLRQKFNAMVVPSYLKIKENYETKELANNLSNLQSAVEVQVESGLNAIANGQPYQTQADELENLLTQIKTLNPDFDIQKARQNAANTFYNQTVEASVLNLTKNADNDYTAAYEKLNQYQKGKVPKGQTPDKWQQHLKNIRSDLDNMRLTAVQTQKVADAEDVRRAEGITALLNNGIQPSAEDLAWGEGFYSAQKKSGEWADIRANSVFARLSQEQRTKQIKEAQEGGGILGKRQVAMKKVNDAINVAVRKDPMGFSFKQGTIMAEDEPFNPLAPTPDSLAKRKNKRDYVQLHHGLQNVPILTNEEAQNFIKNFDMLSVAEKTQLVYTYGQDSYIQTLLSNEGRGAIAHAFANPSITDAIFDGQEKLAEKAVVFDTGNGHPDALFNDMLDDGVLKTVGRANARMATNLVFASLLPQGTTESATNNREIYERAFESVVGTTVKFRDQQTILPKPKGNEAPLTSEEFEDIMDMMEYTDFFDDPQFEGNEPSQIEAMFDAIMDENNIFMLNKDGGFDVLQRRDGERDSILGRFKMSEHIRDAIALKKEKQAAADQEFWRQAGDLFAKAQPSYYKMGIKFLGKQL